MGGNAADAGTSTNDVWGYLSTTTNPLYSSPGLLNPAVSDSQLIGGNPGVPNPQPQQAASGGAPIFNPAAGSATASLTTDPNVGLPSSDQQILAELKGTQIITGMQTTYAFDPDTKRKTPVQAPTYTSSDKLMSNLETLPREQLLKLQSQMEASGFMPQGAPLTGVPDATTEIGFLRLLATAANMQQYGSNVTPQQILDQASKGQSKTDVSTAVDLSDPMTARGVVNAMFENILGRAPNSEDISGFVSALQSYEQNNPGVTTTTQSVSANGTVTKTKQTSKTGGMGSSLSLRGGDVAAAQEYIDQTHGPEEAQVGIDTLARMFGQLVGVA